MRFDYQQGQNILSPPQCLEWLFNPLLLYTYVHKAVWQSQSQRYGIKTDRQSASLSWCQAPICDQRPIFLLRSLIIFIQLRVCWCGAPSLKRGRICSFQLLLGLASGVFLGSESRGTHDYILLSQYWDYPNLEIQVPVFISPMNRVDQLWSQALGSVSACISTYIKM
jgi:hypothetical protein